MLNTAIQGPSAHFVEGPFTGWDGGNYRQDAGFRESTVSWDVAQRAATLALGLRATGLQGKLGLHGPHHSFGKMGRRPHLQLNIWQKGVKGSDRAWRLPFPKFPWKWW